MADKQFDASLMDYMFSSNYKLHRAQIENQQPPIIDDLSEKEALAVANEIIEIFAKHKLSYKNSYRVSLAITTALASGGIELYKNEVK